jgi:hypothetical protein
MSVANVVMEARAAGIQLRVEGDNLLLEAPAAPSPSVLEQLSLHKPAILLWFQPGVDGWSADDWYAYFGERAGIAEFDGGLPRSVAEAQAFACCVTEWMNRNPETSSPEQCVVCGGGDSANDPLLPFGVEPDGHAWLHSRCWQGWYERREADAAIALAKMGIEKREAQP